MTQEDKELLLKDLCVRLPYGVKISLNTEGIQNIGVLDALYPNDECIIVDHLEKRFPLKNGYGTVDYGRFSLEESNFKPYLRPMSNMTEEEEKDFKQMIGGSNTNWYLLDKNKLVHPKSFYNVILNILTIGKIVDWLNRKKFDYRGLIEMGLALEAPKDMYKF